MGKAKKVLGLLLLFNLVAVLSFTQEFTIGGFPSLAPYALVSRVPGKPEVVVGGIIKDIADLVALETGFTFNFYFPPRRRMEEEVKNDRLDILPLVRPEWLKEPGVFIWSLPLLKERMIFITTQESTLSIRSSQDLEGVRLGLIAGFIYPELPVSYKYLREDAATVVRNIHRLDFQWIHAVYGSDREILFRLQLHPGKYKIHPYSPTTVSLQWAIAKRLGPPGELIQKTLNRMSENGTIAKILKSYE